MKVDSPSSEVPDILVAAPEVTPSVEVLSITEGNIGDEDPHPPTHSGLPTRGSVSEPLNERVGGDKKKKRDAVMKVARKAHLGGSSDSDGDDLGADPFDNLEIIRDLIDQFTLFEEVDHLANLDLAQFVWESLRTYLKSGHHILAHLKWISCQEEEASKVQGDLQAEVDSLHRKITEVEHLVEEKVVENEDLLGALQREELVLIELKAALILEEEKKKEAEIKVTKLEAQMLKFALKAIARVVEEFKTSSEMKDLNIAFG
ncbi:hypothetical protein COCNU_scaffold003376G000010 [Cocos nucifera]|nr:hypothetical protein [Cocos nucifera]